MALARFKKIEIIGLREAEERLLSLLQRLGNVQLIETPLAEPVSLPTEEGFVSDINRLEEAISFLAAFEPKSGFIEGMAGLKPFIFSRQVDEVSRSFDWGAIVDELSDSRRSLAEWEQGKEKLEQQKRRLYPWKNFAVALDDLQPTEFCQIILGSVGDRDYPLMLEAAASAGIVLNAEPVERERNRVYLSIIFFPEDSERMDSILKEFHFEEEHFGTLVGTVRENLENVDGELRDLEKRIAGIRERLIALAGRRFTLMMIHDFSASARNVLQTGRQLPKQAFTFVLSGWIRTTDVENLQKEMARTGDETALFISDPNPDDEVPVVLENRGFFKPFEFITQIYGMPKYGEIDPTPFLAPFFFIYFGFCVSDAGYGLLLVIASIIVLKKYEMGPTGTNFWRMFLYCGISTVVVGVLTGSYFGNLPDLLGESFVVMKPLARWKDELIVLDPMKEPTKLLGVALSFGVIQVWFGNIVAAIGNLKNRRYLDILMDQVPMLTFLFGLTGLALRFLQIVKGNSFGWFGHAAIAGAVVLVLTQGRSEKGIGSKMFYGVYNLYMALSGYLSDIMSYSRLWALGLVTGVMAVTINLLAVQFSLMIPAIFPFLNGIAFLRVTISVVVLVLIFVLGHLVSFMMNLLGAFVHPLRLQFVEFFSKFFKSGGSRFKPFKEDSKYVRIKYERS
jgi:V/A-type H+/Na+-transporting ATPase subunit I